MPRILVLNGPNVNLLGTREPALYGATTLEALDATLADQARDAGVALESFQSNAEHELVTRVQQAPADGFEMLILNPAAFTHTSVALRDALLAVDLPFIEVHVSNIHAREAFRRRSFFSDIASGVITGLGARGYELALDAAIEKLKTSGD